MSILGWGECAHFIVDVDCRVGGEVGCVGSVLLLPPTWQTEKRHFMLYNTSETLHFRNVVCVNALDSRPAWACLRSGGGAGGIVENFLPLVPHYETPKRYLRIRYANS